MEGFSNRLAAKGTDRFCYQDVSALCWLRFVPGMFHPTELILVELKRAEAPRRLSCGDASRCGAAAQDEAKVLRLIPVRVCH